MALGSTQPLTEMITRSISWGKGGHCVRLTTYHRPVPLLWNLGTLTSWNPLGPSGPVTGLLYLYLLHLRLTFSRRDLRSSVTLRNVDFIYRRFGTNHRSHFKGSRSPRRNLLVLFDPKRPQLTSNIHRLHFTKGNISLTPKRKPDITRSQDI